MLTVIVRRDAEPNVIQLTQENVMRELSGVNGSEMLLVDRWQEGLHQVRTPYVCLVEADCTLSANYIASNLGLMNKGGQKGKNLGMGKGAGTGGYMKMAMLASCLGVDTFANRIYSYKIGGLAWSDEALGTVQTGRLTLEPNRSKASSALYHVQVGFVPGAIIRMASIKSVIDEIKWDTKPLVDLSADVSFHLWSTGRRIEVNPNTTYVSTNKNLEKLPPTEHHPMDSVVNIFSAEGIT